jgi:hypothetical protein
MNTIQLHLNFERDIREAVEIGNPWAFDGLIEETCSTDAELIGIVSQIVAEEYRTRLSGMTPDEMDVLYREFYLEASDANKDWLLGEVIEEIEFTQEVARIQEGTKPDTGKENR